VRPTIMVQRGGHLAREPPSVLMRPSPSPERSSGRGRSATTRPVHRDQASSTPGTWRTRPRWRGASAVTGPMGPAAHSGAASAPASAAPDIPRVAALAGGVQADLPPAPGTARRGRECRADPGPSRCRGPDAPLPHRPQHRRGIVHITSSSTTTMDLVQLICPAPQMACITRRAW